MKTLLVRFTAFGLIAPLIILPIAYGTDLGKSGVSLPLFGFLWPTYIFLMGVQHAPNTFLGIFYIALIVGLNVLFFLFLGWLFGLGYTKNKWFYVLPIISWLIVFDLLYFKMMQNLIN